ncbi:MAG: 4-alpha-glucanotransferase, partial [Candidatus Omnitrophica bacterium]|nr:4-alpha-glucanotransferase [Candidatus Omnitrophota bacterium]
MEKLGIYGAIQAVRERALAEGGEEAKSRAAQEVRAMIIETLSNPRDGGPRLPQEILDLLLEDAQVRSNGNMVMIGRKAADGASRLGPSWHREWMVEDKILKNQPLWDFIRLTPNQRAQDDGFTLQWLFPEDGQGPLPTDGVRVAYYREGPGEKLMSEFEALSQARGTVFIPEMLGNVSDALVQSSKRAGGYVLNPKIWGLNRRSRYHPLNDQDNDVSMFSVADSANISSAWAALSDNEKMDLLRDFWPGTSDQDLQRHRTTLTPEVHEKLLQMSFAPREVYPQMPMGSVPLIAILTLTDIAGLDDRYRLNLPGQQTSWNRRLPQAVSSGELLEAVRGRSSTLEAGAGIALTRRLLEARRRARQTARPRPEAVELLGARPDHQKGTVQIRVLDSPAEQTTPFMVEAFVKGNPKDVSLILLDETGNPVGRFPMSRVENSRNGEGNWMVSMTPSQVGVYKDRIEITGPDDTVKKSDNGLLAAVDRDANLNPLSPDYALQGIEAYRKDSPPLGESLSLRLIQQFSVQSGEVGGINLNPVLLNLEIKRDGNGAPLPWSQQPLQKI